MKQIGAIFGINHRLCGDVSDTSSDRFIFWRVLSVDAFSERLESRILHPVIGILLSFTDFIISPGKIGGSKIQFVGFDKKRIE